MNTQVPAPRWISRIFLEADHRLARGTADANWRTVQERPLEKGAHSSRSRRASGGSDRPAAWRMTTALPIG